jgi:hypothetical protein
MIITDPKGYYELKVDKDRRIVYEKVVGMITAEDYTRLTDEYVNKIVPYLGKGDWMKLCDARQTKPSTLNTPEHINKELSRLAPLGFKGGAILIDSITLKMQITRGAKNVAEASYFDNEKDADNWLRSQGF